MINRITFWGCFLLVGILCYWAVRPLFVPGFFPMHDDTQPARVYEMYTALADGQFPVRWVPDLGYGSGYPLFNFYAPLPYYLGALPMFVGVDAVTATKIMMGIGISMAGVTMFLLAASLAGPVVGVVSAVAYLYAPYHAVDLYVRGAVGELYGYAFLPLVLWGIYQLLINNRRQGIVIGSVGCSLVLLSHNILGMVVVLLLALGTVLCGSVAFFQKKIGIQMPLLQALVLVLLLGVGISSFFTIPALMEKNYTKITTLTEGGSDFHAHFVYADQLWDSPWGYGGSAPGRLDGMSFKIGKVHIVLALLAWGALAWGYRRKTLSGAQLAIAGISGAVLLLSIGMMLPFSGVIWDHLPGFAYIQYPWRFLNLTVFSLAVGMCFLFWGTQPVIKGLGYGAALVLLLWFNVKYFVPQTADTRGAADYVSAPQLFFFISKISDEYLPRDYPAPTSISQVVPAGIPDQPAVTTVSVERSDPTDHRYHLSLAQDALVTTTFSYYPGWQALVDNRRVAIQQRQGMMAFFVPAGSHDIRLQLRTTGVQRIANAISLFSLFLLGYVSLFKSVKMPWGRSRRLMW